MQRQAWMWRLRGGVVQVERRVELPISVRVILLGQRLESFTAICSILRVLEARGLGARNVDRQITLVGCLVFAFRLPDPAAPT